MRPGVRIGVDVGSVRVGVASCDPSGTLASPVRTLDRRGGSDVEELVGIVRELDAIEVVVGLPRSLSGEEGPAARSARQYARVLASRLEGVQVRLHDERLTTVDAHRGLRESGVSGREQRSIVDQAAAVLILQGALEAERSTGRPPGERVRTGRRKPRKDKYR